ncbi:hypothetical protein VNO77_19035 [Canavalia gladiata]|uniref:Uncharacterized protein n=1 Tax=Canavalia gladiata TaxID=3824 RepID=A0AAN9LMM4_CANGL
MLTWGHFRITEQVPIFLPNCALEFIALEPATAGPFMDNYGWRYPVNDQISTYPTPDYSPRIRTPNLIPALDHGDPVLSTNSSVHLLADIGTSTDNLDFGFFLILWLDTEDDSAMTKFLGPHQGRYLYQGWTKSLICLNWTMVPINERLSRVTECDYRVLCEFCTRYTRVMKPVYSSLTFVDNTKL